MFRKKFQCLPIKILKTGLLTNGYDSEQCDLSYWVQLAFNGTKENNYELCVVKKLTYKQKRILVLNK